MSPRQRSEDPARNLHSIWLGLNDLVRWWFDATYTEWAIGIGFFLFLFPLLWLVLPFGVLLLLLAFEWGRWGVALAGDETLQRWTRATGPRGVRRGRIIITGIVLVTLVLMFSHLGTWLKAMHWWLALPVALWVASRIVKRARPYVNANRPVTYWVHTFLAIGRGPRPVRRPETIAPAVDLAPYIETRNKAVAELARVTNTPVMQAHDWMKERETAFAEAVAARAAELSPGFEQVIRLASGRAAPEVVWSEPVPRTKAEPPVIKARITRPPKHRAATLLDALTGGVMLVRYEGHRWPRLRTTTSYLKETNRVR